METMHCVESTNLLRSSGSWYNVAAESTLYAVFSQSMHARKPLWKLDRLINLLKESLLTFSGKHLWDGKKLANWSFVLNLAAIRGAPS